MESISIEGYNIVRRDKKTHAGGVLMYVRSDLAYNHRQDLQNDNLEDLWIELLLQDTKKYILEHVTGLPETIIWKIASNLQYQNWRGNVVLIF